MDRAQKLIFIAAHSKLERRDFSTDEEKDASCSQLQMAMRMMYCMRSFIDASFE